MSVIHLQSTCFVSDREAFVRRTSSYSNYPLFRSTKL